MEARCTWHLVNSNDVTVVISESYEMKTQKTNRGDEKVPEKKHCLGSERMLIKRTRILL